MATTDKKNRSDYSTTVPNKNSESCAAEIGLTRKQVHEARARNCNRVKSMDQKPHTAKESPVCDGVAGGASCLGIGGHGLSQRLDCTTQMSARLSNIDQSERANYKVSRLWAGGFSF